jgi:nucleotide-binding universal stress UspA family protein
MKNITLLVHDDAGQEARLQVALDITRAFEGHLTCVDVSIVPVLADDGFTGGMGSAILLAEERNREAVNRGRIEGRLAHEGISWSWIDATGALAPTVEDSAILSELIVVNRRLDSFPWPDMRSTAADLVVKSHKPILAVLDDAAGFNIAGRALVAWDGSAQADAALQAAVPLLKHAAEVTLLEIGDGSVSVPAEDAAMFLSRRGISSEVLRKGLKDDVADVLLREARRMHADYVVMGGYGHSRIKEALFGGVTRRMLSECPVPLFLAH